MPKMTQDTAEKAYAVQEGYARAMQNITDNADLSAAGKQRAAAKVHVDFNAQMDKIKSDFASSARTTEQVTATDLFGGTQLTGQDAISVRDAADRAALLEDPAEAQEKYQWAAQNGDEHLARAVAQHAFNLASSPIGGAAWVPVLDQHAARTPGFEDKLNEMVAARSASVHDATQSAFTFALIKPSILDRLGDHHIQNLAADPETSTDAADVAAFAGGA